MRRHSNKIIALILIASGLWGVGRLYFSLTDGFLVSNIVSALPREPGRETRPLSAGEEEELARALAQPYHYLGKGCQSYVFESEDGRYVVKFFKYQRFRPQAWLKALSFFPPIERLLEEKQVRKQKKLGLFMQAWKVAFDELKEESGLVAVHLNKSDHLRVDFTLYDKLGFKHTVPADSLEFLIQRKADRLIPWIEREMASGASGKVKILLDDLIQTLVAEYRRGLSDNDHALMQNTGVYRERPLHIDVGQFTRNARFADPAVWHQELYNKTYQFRLWLLKAYPQLGEHLTLELQEAIGSDWSAMKPYFGRQHE